MRSFRSIAAILALVLATTGLTGAVMFYDRSDASADSPDVCIGRYVPEKEVDPAKIIPNADPELLAKLSKRTAYEMTLLEEQCFDSVEEAEQVSASAGSNESMQATSSFPWFDIAKVFDYENYGGDQYWFQTQNYDVCNGIDYYYPLMPSGWNDRVSSVKMASGNGCEAINMYENSYYGGFDRQCAFFCPSIGTMSNNMSSFHTIIYQEG